MSGIKQRWLTERRTFIVLAFAVLLVSTQSFDGDLPALAFSLVVLGGAMFLD